MTPPREPATHAGRTLLAEIEHWRGVAEADIELVQGRPTTNEVPNDEVMLAGIRHELWTTEAILRLARRLLPVIEQEAVLLATTEPRWPPVRTET